MSDTGRAFFARMMERGFRAGDKLGAAGTMFIGFGANCNLSTDLLEEISASNVGRVVFVLQNLEFGY